MEIVQDSEMACDASRGQEWRRENRSLIAMPLMASNASLTDPAEQARLRAGKVGSPRGGMCWETVSQVRTATGGEWLAGLLGVPAYPGGWSVLSGGGLKGFSDERASDGVNEVEEGHGGEPDPASIELPWDIGKKPQRDGMGFGASHPQLRRTTGCWHGQPRHFPILPMLDSRQPDGIYALYRGSM